MTKSTSEYVRLVSEMLVSYRINWLDSKEMDKRVLMIEDGVREHWFVDGLYAFTITMFTKEFDDWSVHSRYYNGKSYKIEFDDKLDGYRIKENKNE